MKSRTKMEIVLETFLIVVTVTGVIALVTAVQKAGKKHELASSGWSQSQEMATKIRPLF